MANAKKRDLLQMKAAVCFARKIKNLSEQADNFNRNNKSNYILEVATIPPLDNKMYPKLFLRKRKK